jgi:hypothetical protein
MNIYEIKRLPEAKSPYFFSRKTLKFFRQTMRDFKVKKQDNGKYRISCPMWDRFTRRRVGTTVRDFNPITNELEMITEEEKKEIVV